MTIVGRVGDYWRAADRLRKTSERAHGLFWISRVNRRAGALIAYALLPTSVSPNWVSVAGLVVHTAGALLVALADTPIALPRLLVILVLWQLGFSLDCADGQLARARGQSTPFGAWLDVVLDFVSHCVVMIVLSVYVVEGLDVEPEAAAATAGGLVSLMILPLFASALRNAVMGTVPAVTGDRRLTTEIMALGRQLTDYGAFLFLASVLLAWPVAELGFLVVVGLLNGIAVAAQVVVNWYDSSTAPARERPDRPDATRT